MLYEVITISQKSVSGSFDLNQYELKIPKKYDITETQDIIKNLLFNSPWRISTKSPSVQLKSPILSLVVRLFLKNQ